MNRLNTIPLALAVLLAAGPASAAPGSFVVPGTNSGCFDFDGLNVGHVYRVGDVVGTRYGPVSVVDYTLNGSVPTPANPEAVKVQVDNSSLAGNAPELLYYLADTVFVPDRPLSRVTFDVAEGWAGGAPTGAHSNIGVNGVRLEVPRSLRSLNGRVIGRNGSPNQVEVTVDIDPPAAGSTWAKGRVTLEAVPGGTINRVVIGGRQVKLDNFCFEAS